MFTTREEVIARLDKYIAEFKASAFHSKKSPAGAIWPILDENLVADIFKVTPCVLPSLCWDGDIPQPLNPGELETLKIWSSEALLRWLKEGDPSKRTKRTSKRRPPTVKFERIVGEGNVAVEIQ